MSNGPGAQHEGEPSIDARMIAVRYADTHDSMVALACAIDQFAAEARRAMKERCAALLDDRAARFPREPIFNGDIMRDELRSRAAAIRALPDEKEDSA